MAPVCVPDNANISLFQLKKILIFFYFLKSFIYLFLERGREGETMCGCLSHALHWVPDLQPRHVP